MKKKLKEELRKLSTDIITSRDMNDISEMYDAAKDLYEKLAVLNLKMLLRQSSKSSLMPF